MEDDYFKKILRLNQLVEHEETRLGRQNAFFQESMQLLKAQKTKVGARNTRAPSFTGIPLTVQRKLARDGMYTQLFTCHPEAKIALAKRAGSPAGATSCLEKLPPVGVTLAKDTWSPIIVFAFFRYPGVPAGPSGRPGYSL